MLRRPLISQIPQTEKTPFYPRSPYGVAKLCVDSSVTFADPRSYGFWVRRPALLAVLIRQIVKNYRESYGKCGPRELC